MIMISKFKRLWRNEDGVAAIELAIYSVAFFAMLFGGIYASILGFTSTSLHSAVEAAARCSALGITCTDATTTQNYAISAFHNLTTVTPTFTSDTQACGSHVHGSINYNLDWIVSRSTIPLTADACFPPQTASVS